MGYTAQKMKFFITDFFSKCDLVTDLVTFTEEIRNGKLRFLCSASKTVKTPLIKYLNFFFDFMFHLIDLKTS